ncbi:MAG TPA: HAD family hydrolase [Chloroflexota bacterium]|nr:HAD family hydrolase [Chloroflexota bacterium]
MPDLELAQRNAPILFFDRAEPFLPDTVGFAVLRKPGPSPTFDRYLNLNLPDGRRADAVIEYALWTDWDIQHLYELEHVWSYVDHDGRLLYAEASAHGRFGPLITGSGLAAAGERPVAYAEPGKHGMHATPDLLITHPTFHAGAARSAGPLAGSHGLLVGRPIAGRLESSRRSDGLANAFLRQKGFVPTFAFDRRWDALTARWLPWEGLIEEIPGRLAAILAQLEAERARRKVWAVCFDLGDTLMMEVTEEKDATATTQRADPFPGAADLIRDLRAAGYLIALVADTRPGTYRNFLRQHNLYDAFDVFAISEELDCEKPDPRMFQHALTGLGIAPEEAHRVVMVGNNLARDVRGANALGITSIHVRHNDRYPAHPADAAEQPRFVALSCAEVGELIRGLEG